MPGCMLAITHCIIFFFIKFGSLNQTFNESVLHIFILCITGNYNDTKEQGQRKTNTFNSSIQAFLSLYAEPKWKEVCVLNIMDLTEALLLLPMS